MNLQGRELEFGLHGDDVALLHQELKLLGFDIGSGEIAEKQFGKSTRSAVSQLQRDAGLTVTGRVDVETARRINAAVDERGSLIVRGQVLRESGEPVDAVRVRAADRDLRREEPLGETVSADGGHYRIAYQADRFIQGEEGSADLVVRVLDERGNEIGHSETLFDAPADAVLNVIISVRDAAPRSEYEELRELLDPVLDGVDPAELTTEDVEFLVGETGVPRDQVQLLVHAAGMAGEAGIPVEACYGFGRVGLPTELGSLLKHDLGELRAALENAITGGIVPQELRHRLDEIIDILRRSQATPKVTEQERLAAYQAVGRLVGERSDAGLAGFAVQAHDLDASPPRDLGRDTSGNRGVFAFTYNAPPGLGDAPGATRRLALYVTDLDGVERYAAEISFPVVQEVALDVRVAVPEEVRPDVPLADLAGTLHIDLPDGLLDDLANRDVHGLADIRRAGGLGLLAGLPVPEGDSSVSLLDAHASLHAISPDMKVNAVLIEKGYTGPASIAAASRTGFVQASAEIMGSFKAVQLHAAAKAWTGFSGNVVLDLLGTVAGGQSSRLTAVAQTAASHAAEKAACGCRDCETAVGPLAYLADLLDYVLAHVELDGKPITRDYLADTFLQPFARLPADCAAADEEVRQARICVEVMRAYLAAHPPAPGSRAVLDGAERAWRLAAYQELLSRWGSSFEEIRLARTAESARRAALADRLGITLTGPRPDALDRLLRDPAAAPGTANALTEEVLERLFGLADTTRDPLVARPDPELLVWQLAHLRVLWQAEEWPADLPEDTPVVDPDVVGPDDFRSPQAKAGVAAQDGAFDLWLRRHTWVTDQLAAFLAMTTDRRGQQVPDLAAMLAAMYQQVGYPAAGGDIGVVPWAATTLPGDFPALLRALARPADAAAARRRIATDLRLPPEAFTRLAQIYAQDALNGTDQRETPVTEELCGDVRSILVQARKTALATAWCDEEQAVAIRLGGMDFWPAARPPEEGQWPPIPPAGLPMVDPTVVAIDDLPDVTAGRKARALWRQRGTRLEEIAEELLGARETGGIDAMLSHALGDPDPGDPLPHDLDALQNRLGSPDPAVVAAAERNVVQDLHLTVQNFGRLMLIRAKALSATPAQRPTAAEWNEAVALLTRAQKDRRELPGWTAAETAAGLQPWQTRKAKLPPWRATAQSRADWERALRTRTRPPSVDPDLIGPADLRDPRAGQLPYDIWRARRTWVDSELSGLRTVREGAADPMTGLSDAVLRAVGVPLDELVALAAERQSGGAVGTRLAQLDLTPGSLAHLLRVRDLVLAGLPVLDAEWAGVDAILAQVGKLRRRAEWRAREQAAGLFVGPDHFVIRSGTPELPAWLSSQANRRAWEAVLGARVDQELSARRGFSRVVDAVEEATLPRLRDALVLASDLPGNDLSSKAKAVTDRLLIDAAVAGCQKTTRVAQAIETLQGMLFGLRTGQLRDTYPGLLPVADDFDQEWRWIGSYAAWRAAMFVHMYPENVLIPTLRRRQTPAFREIVTQLRAGRRLTPPMAREAASAYAGYFQDVCTLRLGPICHAVTALRAVGREPVDGDDRRMTHLFARGGKTGAVYWSVYDPAAPDGDAQTFWRKVEGLDHVIDLVGAAPARVGPDQRFVCLFARVQDNARQALKLVKLDLSSGTWSDAVPLDLCDRDDGQEAVYFTAVVAQSTDDSLPPRLVMRVPDGSVWSHRLDLDLGGWAEDDWRLLVTPSRGREFRAISAMIETSPDQFYLIVESGRLQQYGNTVWYRLYGRGDDGRWRSGGSGRFAGAVPWPNGDLFLFLQQGSATAGVRISAGSTPDLGIGIWRLSDLQLWLTQVPGVSLNNIVITDGSLFQGLTLWQFLNLPQSSSMFQGLLGTLFGSYYRERARVYVQAVEARLDKPAWRAWKHADDLVREFAKQSLSQVILRIFGYPRGEDAASVRAPVPFPNRGYREKGAEFGYATGAPRIAPAAGGNPGRLHARQKKLGQAGITLVRLERGGDTLAEQAPVTVNPAVAGPFHLTERLSSEELRLRAATMSSVFDATTGHSASILTYLQEAWYHIPILLAQELQRHGQHVSALDWFRTVYDFTAPSGQRKIYPGLVREESLSAVYGRADDWLLDPLDPHAIAGVRAGTATRFTLLSIIRCLLEFADAEFTRDTSESIPRARTLYMTVLELLDAPELRQAPGACDELVGTLDIEVGEAEWETVWITIRRELSSIGDMKILRRAVSDVRTAMSGAGTLAERVSAAMDAVNTAKAAMPSALDLGQVLDGKAVDHARLQLALLAVPELEPAARRTAEAAASAYRQAVEQATGKDAAALEQEELPWLAAPLTTVPVDDAVATSSTYERLIGTVLRGSPLAKVKRDISSRYLISVLVPAPSFRFCVPPNPVLRALRLHAELNLYKLRNCRNISGALRRLEPYAAPTDAVGGLPAIGAGGQLVLPSVRPRTPTPYRYATLVERAKQLVAQAQQVESALLAAVEKRDAEAYNLLKARQDIAMARAGVTLQDLRVGEAQDGVRLAELQQQRAQLQADHFDSLLEEGVTGLEQASLGLLYTTAALQLASSITSFVAAALPASISAGFPSGVSIAYSPQGSAGAVAGGLSSLAASSSTTASILSTLASYERRAQDWAFQRTLAMQDVRIGEQQIRLAEDHVRVLGQERVIAELHTEHAEATAEFLATKFTNVEFYDWLGRTLEGVYRYFLQQATATAQLAAEQLAFERQETPPPVIQADYWEPSHDTGTAVSPGDGPDRRGITGSLRLAADITRLDQYALETAVRKLQLTKTISLSRLAPAEFQRFLNTGVLLFATPLTLFDQDFPGHYLCLVHRVRLSVIALVPAVDGIHATLTSSRSSRVVLGPPAFQTVTLQQGPDSIALTSPRDATGLFELEAQSALRNPFEGIGVETTWELRMPRAANRFDYRSIADVLLTIEYTALDSSDHRQRVLSTINRTFSADRPFSFRHELSDQWYDLNNPELSSTPMVVRFATARDDFPPNIDELRIQQIALYFARADGVTDEIPVTHLRFTDSDAAGPVGGGAVSVEGIVSTRRGNAGSWSGMVGRTPTGIWELALPNEEPVTALFQQEQVKDILLVITYSGRTPEWPA